MCTDIVHVANSLPRVRHMLDPGVTKCTFCRVYRNTRGHCATCIKVHVADSQPRVFSTHGRQLATCILILVATCPCVSDYTRQTVGRM